MKVNVGEVGGGEGGRWGEGGGGRGELSGRAHFIVICENVKHLMGSQR